MRKISCSLMFLFLISIGCAPVSKELRKEVAKEINFKEVIKDPEAYKGKIVLLSGVILGSKKQKGRDSDRDASKTGGHGGKAEGCG